jgi:hypothetical protein
MIWLIPIAFVVGLVVGAIAVFIWVGGTLADAIGGRFGWR